METKRASYQSRLAKAERQLSQWLSRVFVLLTLLGCVFRSPHLRDRLDAALRMREREVTELILRHAALRVGRKNPPRKGTRGYVDPRSYEAHFSRRAAIGSGLRRALHPPLPMLRRTGAPGDDLIGRVQVLRRALADKEKLIAELARRMRLGLTRTGFAYTRAALALELWLSAAMLGADAPAGADTS